MWELKFDIFWTIAKQTDSGFLSVVFCGGCLCSDFQGYNNPVVKRGC
jgi:hypothetical protein